MICSEQVIGKLENEKWYAQTECGKILLKFYIPNMQWHILQFQILDMYSLYFHRPYQNSEETTRKFKEENVMLIQKEAIFYLRNFCPCFSMFHNMYIVSDINTDIIWILFHLLFCFGMYNLFVLFHVLQVGTAASFFGDNIKNKRNMIYPKARHSSEQITHSKSLRVCLEWFKIGFDLIWFEIIWIDLINKLNLMFGIII